MRAAIARGLTHASRRALRSAWGLAPLVAMALSALACHRGRPERDRSLRESDRPAASRPIRDESMMVPTDALLAYRHAGFLVGAGDVPFIGSLAYLAGAVPESTIVVVAISISNRALTFVREGDKYRASYEVTMEFRRDTGLVARAPAHEEVRVGSFKETTRDEESVIFQQFVSLPPGAVTVTVAVHDAGSTRRGTARAFAVVPRLEPGALSAPIAVLRARARTTRSARPQLIVSPRATAVFGRDSIAEFYVESYASLSEAESSAVEARVVDDAGHSVFADTLPLSERGAMVRSAVVRVPVDRIGFGVLSLAVSKLTDSPAGSRRVPTRAPLLVTFGEGFAVSSFEQMLGYLRYFTTAARLRSLRDTTPEDRSRAWTAFLQATDPLPSTVEHEGLRDYFARLSNANMRFQEETVPGWLTDRGMIYSALGEPDNRIEPASSDPMQRDRVQVWEYQRYRVRFIFIDQTGFGRWRLTPSSEAEYNALMLRLSR